MSLVRAQDVLDRLQAQGVRAGRLENDSRRVRPGDVFVAYPGARVDGRDFIANALERGAAAVLWELGGYAWNPKRAGVNLAVEDLQTLAGDLAHLVCGRPSEALRLIGITGTNGKTSCSHWLAAALGDAGQPCTVIGTLGNGFPGELADSANTTPDAIALHAALAAFRARGARACAMEASSIGLAQGRCNGARFDTALFTNLTRDHLDFHRTMDDYAAAKRELFVWPQLANAVVNLDDPFGCRLAVETVAPNRIGYTLADADSKDCRIVLRARELRHEAAGVRFMLAGAGREAEIAAPVVGAYNVSNLLGVAGVLIAAGVEFDALPGLLGRLQPPAGRMQRYGGESGSPLVVVDYAHTPDALASALTALRPLAQARGGRLVCVFGCGGDRDPGKRPQMGEIASRLADAVCLTSDNPRSEEPQAILAQIRVGAGADAGVEIDRTRAIAETIARAAAADVILVAGKGHETYQEIAGVRHPYSDAATVAAALSMRAGPKVTAS